MKRIYVRSDLDRFVNVQVEEIYWAHKELKQGKKMSCSVWTLFPQLRGLGTGFWTNYYGLNGQKETLAYYKNSFLRRNLNNSVKIILKFENYDALKNVFGEFDVKKIHSSLTLFYLTTGKSIFRKALLKFFNGFFENQTLLLLNKEEVKTL